MNPKTLQESLDNFNKELGVLRSLTVDRFGAWYIRFFGRLAFPLYVILLLITMAYVLTSFYYTLNK